MNSNNRSFVSHVRNIIDLYAGKEAVKVGERSMSFAQLDKQAGIIANRMNKILQEKGHDARRGCRVGVYMNKSEWLVPALWAIVRSGFTYVPIDVETPEERLSNIISDSQMEIMLVNNQVEVPAVVIDVLDVSDGFVPQEQYPSVACDNDIAYIIYTSGTTGVPKGIPISYSNLTSFLESLARPDVFGINHDSVLMLFASISFDTSIVPLFGNLYYGAKEVIVVDEDRTNPQKLCSQMMSEKVSYVCLPPTLLTQLSTYDFPDMKTLVSAGEALIQSAADNALGHSYRFVNAYGPTECTVFSTFRDVSPDVPCRNIGVPFPQVVAYVVDEQFRPVERGVVGELVLGGPQLTNGYINRPELNEKAFVANPFEETKEQAPVLYHTGDLVMKMEDGTLDYLGRMDSQVKIRSYRIELGDVKSHIEKCPQVQQSYVRGEKIGSELHIVAYVLLKEGYTDLSPVRSELEKNLPMYMIPDYWLKVDQFELNTNGKIDKSKLHNSLIDLYTHNTGDKTPAEITLTDIFADAYGVEDINIDTDLIEELGLSSIQMMQATVNLANVGMSVTANDIYEFRTIRKLALLSEGKHYYWLDSPSHSKPVIILISGYTSFLYLYKGLADRIREKYNIFVIESYHDNCSYTPRTTEEYVDEYLGQVEPIIGTYGIDVITGFCLGGEMGLYLAEKLYQKYHILPHVVVLDGIPDRFKDRHKNVPLIWKNLTTALNNRRVAQDNCIIESMPDFRYHGPVTAILSDEYQNCDPRVLDLTSITKEQDEGEYYMFEHAEELWNKCYPECEVIFHHVGHYDYLHNVERSVKPLADFFLKLLSQINYGGRE